MFNLLNVTDEQSKLYIQLRNAITDDQGNVAEILLQGVSRDDLRAILTICLPSLYFERCTLTPLGLAISFKNQEVVEVILDAAKEHNILKEVLTNADMYGKFPNGKECTYTPLGLAISFKNQEVVEVILDAAKEHNILKEVLTADMTLESQMVRNVL